MRAFELYPTDFQALGNYNPAEDKLGQRNLRDIRKNRVTLRHLNRLNQIRKARRFEKQKKAPILTLMYGNDDLRSEQEAIADDRNNLRQEVEQAELDLDRKKLAIQRAIDLAKLDNEQRQHIQSMAMKAIKRR